MRQGHVFFPKGSKGALSAAAAAGEENVPERLESQFVAGATVWCTVTPNAVSEEETVKVLRIDEQNGLAEVKWVVQGSKEWVSLQRLRNVGRGGGGGGEKREEEEIGGDGMLGAPPSAAAAAASTTLEKPVSDSKRRTSIGSKGIR